MNLEYGKVWLSWLYLVHKITLFENIMWKQRKITVYYFLFFLKTENKGKLFDWKVNLYHFWFKELDDLLFKPVRLSNSIWMLPLFPGESLEQKVETNSNDNHLRVKRGPRTVQLFPNPTQHHADKCEMVFTIIFNSSFFFYCVLQKPYTHQWRKK